MPIVKIEKAMFIFRYSGIYYRSNLTGKLNADTTPGIA